MLRIRERFLCRSCNAKLCCPTQRLFVFAAILSAVPSIVVAVLLHATCESSSGCSLMAELAGAAAMAVVFYVVFEFGDIHVCNDNHESGTGKAKSVELNEDKG